MSVVIAVDAMGGDTAPESVVAGVLAAVTDSDLHVLLVGDEALLSPLVGDTQRITIRHTDSVISLNSDPIDAIRGDAGSSLVVAAPSRT